jgi:hypothetical protein
MSLNPVKFPKIIHFIKVPTRIEQCIILISKQGMKEVVENIPEFYRFENR